MPRGPDLYDDGPDRRYRQGGGIEGVFYFWLFVGIIAGLVTLIGVLF